MLARLHAQCGSVGARSAPNRSKTLRSRDSIMKARTRGFSVEKECIELFVGDHNPDRYRSLSSGNQQRVEQDKRRCSYQRALQGAFVEPTVRLIESRDRCAAEPGNRYNHVRAVGGCPGSLARTG